MLNVEFLITFEAKLYFLEIKKKKPETP
ncbi:hypothetical protein KAOT1_08353 [Kordia algicida OT-1]|uniref:Uncharacterized protein n=1 Tax=Kordia algicida OT-1 TaxID=391587 RepID=A9DYQ9_9FLAO|nr:hypothetical protein KAOT1_08353 [Kordia algicida OT-1]